MEILSSNSFEMLLILAHLREFFEPMLNSSFGSPTNSRLIRRIMMPR